MTGWNFVFIPGPTNAPEPIRQAMAIPYEDQRAPDVPDFTLPLFRDLKKVFKTETGEIFVFTGSGTAGWEAAIANTLSPGDKVLTARYGLFTSGWIDMCRRFGLDVDVVETTWGEGAPIEEFARRLKADKAHAYKAVLVCHNETTTGVTTDMAAVRRALDDARHPAMLFADGVSSIASIDFRMDAWGIDVAVSGSQKGFMLPTGLAILAVSPKALEAAKAAKNPRCYFDMPAMLDRTKTGYYPYTPAMTFWRGLRASVDMLFAEGLENVFARHRRLAGGVRAAVDAWGLKLCAKQPSLYSDTVSAIYVPEGVDANALVKHAYLRYNLSLGVGLQQLNGKVFRIGHLGMLNELMVLGALAGTELALADIGVKVKLGSGVAAAQAHFRATAEKPLAAAAQ